jgi:hypothetical protein
MNEDRSLTDSPFEDLEGGLLIFCPLPFVVLLEQGMERFHYVRKPRNPVAIEINETDELMDTSHHRRPLPLHNICNLLIIHLKAFLTNIDPKEFYLFPMEFTLLCVAEELHVLQALESIADTLNMFGFGFVVVEHIVQVVFQVFIE